MYVDNSKNLVLVACCKECGQELNVQLSTGRLLVETCAKCFNDLEQMVEDLRAEAEGE